MEQTAQGNHAFYSHFFGECRTPGKERDDSTGLYYYGARYYAPWLGRWMSADPAGPVDGLNLYEYVSGNPVGYVDDGGMEKKKPATPPDPQEIIEQATQEIKQEVQKKVPIPMKQPVLPPDVVKGQKEAKEAAGAVEMYFENLQYGAEETGKAIREGDYGKALEMGAMTQVGIAGAAAVATLIVIGLATGAVEVAPEPEKTKPPVVQPEPESQEAPRGEQEMVPPAVEEPRPEGETSPAAESTVDPTRKAYRAVSEKELQDIRKHGFRPDPEGKSMEEKWFSETKEGAQRFTEEFPELEHVVEVEVPESVYKAAHKDPDIDRTGPGFAVRKEDLSQLKLKEK